jgi:tetratricopeptide (TPR) repeat protein
MSRNFFQRAIDLDPTYALGYVGLAGYYGLSSVVGLMPPEEGWPRLEAGLTRALELDDTLPEVHNGLAALKMFFYRDWAGAEREIKRAIQLDPNYAEVHVLNCFYLVAIGQIDEAIAEGKRALELDPLSARNIRYLGNWFYYARRYDEAIRQYHDALELDPHNPMVHDHLGDAYEQKGLHSEAVAEWEKALTLTGDDKLAAILHDSYARGGFSAALRAVAEKRLEHLNDRSERGEYVPTIEYARAYVRLGDKEQALLWLGKAFEERNMFPLYFSSDPFYDGLRSDPHFEDLIRRVRLPP